MVREIEFASRDDARQIRRDNLLSQFVDDNDDGRQAVLRVKDNIPDSALQKIRGQAADSRQAEREQGGQLELSRTERRNIDFSQPGVNIPKARSVKGIAANEGVDDWMAYADLSATVDENREFLKRGKRDERGARMDQRDSEAFQIDREARAFQRQEQEEIPRAKDAGIREADADAAAFLRSQNVEFDLRANYQGGVFSSSGADADRARDRHAERSARARAMDERQQAPIAPDPLTWAANPGRYDLPGVDTVQPEKVHARRPESAQTRDENRVAPVADSAEQWAQAPDRYDWPGVDLPPGAAGLQGGSPPANPGGDVSETTLQNAGFPDPFAPADFEPGAAESQPMSATATPFGLAPGVDDDVFAEQGDLLDMEEWTDTGDDQVDMFGFGLEADVRKSQGQETRADVEQASAFGLDDRSDAGRGTGRDVDDGEQQGFEVFGGGVRENETLF